MYSEESVPLFGPPLPAPAVFDDHRAFRDFLLVKRKLKIPLWECGGGLHEQTYDNCYAEIFI